MQDFTILPKEIVDSIFEYVPEYGHRVSERFHEQSLYTEKVSACCDLLRYCARLNRNPFNACVVILTSYERVISEDIKMAALRYLEKNRRIFLREYLKHAGWIPADILTDLGFANVFHWTKINLVCSDDREIMYNNIEYYIKVIDLYALMILLDNGFMSKKEFDAECSLIADIDVVLEVIFCMYDHVYHVFNTAIRHFIGRIRYVADRMEKKQAVVDHIIYDEWYDGSSTHIGNIRRRTRMQKLNIDVDKDILRKVRDEIMQEFRYNKCWNGIADIHSLFYLIESMADEE